MRLQSGMRYFLILLLCLFPLMTFAADDKDDANKKPAVQEQQDVPEITYSQKVVIVVEAKKNPIVLDVRIEQDKKNVDIAAIVDKDTDRDLAQGIALQLVLLTKASTLDDPPKDAKTPGKGLYDYHVRVSRVDTVVLADGEKLAKKTKLKFKPPLMSDLPIHSRPLTRGDEKR